jgi:hypothetical protein
MGVVITKFPSPYMWLSDPFFFFFLFQICDIQNLEFLSEKIKISEFKPEIYISPKKIQILVGN